MDRKKKIYAIQVARNPACQKEKQILDGLELKELL
jgi:hypothetical protein